MKSGSMAAFEAARNIEDAHDGKEPDCFTPGTMHKMSAEDAASCLNACITALEFIAFNNHPAWKDKDRRARARDTLLKIGTHVRVRTQP